MKFLYIHNILTLLITNFWSWALEKYPEPEFQPVSMELVWPRRSIWISSKNFFS